MTFKNGNIPWNKGKKLSEKHKRKISIGIKGNKNPMFGKHHTIETKRKISESHEKNKQKGMYGKNHPNWKGGRHITNGYWTIYCPNHPRADPKNYVYEHILMVEEILGRYLTKDERVHHINGNKLNNNPENLFVSKNKSEDMKIHKQLQEISYKLIKEKIIKFNREKGEYYINRNYREKRAW